jgi:hypothetical protein
MKKSWLMAAIAVFMVNCSIGLLAQTNVSNLNQLKLMEKFLGNWQLDGDKDTLVVNEFRQYGKAFVETYYQIIDGKKTWLSIWSYSYSPKEGKFNFFGLNSNGGYSTWIASFISEKIWIQHRVQNFNPEKVLGKAEIKLYDSDHIMVTFYNSAGVKTVEQKWFKAPDYKEY